MSELNNQNMIKEQTGILENIIELLRFLNRSNSNQLKKGSAFKYVQLFLRGEVWPKPKVQKSEEDFLALREKDFRFEVIK